MHKGLDHIGDVILFTCFKKIVYCYLFKLLGREGAEKEKYECCLQIFEGLACRRELDVF